MREKDIKRALSILVIVFICFTTINIPTALTVGAKQIQKPILKGIVETFNDNVLKDWTHDPSYKLTEKNNELKIDIDKRAVPYAKFSYKPSMFDLSSKPFISVKLRSEKDVNFIISLNDSKGNIEDGSSNAVCEIIASKYYSIYTFNLSSFTNVDLKKITSVNFLFNSGSPTCKTTAYIDDLKIGQDAIVAPAITNIPEQKTWINAPEQTVNFRGVKDNLKGKYPITITASSADKTLLKDPEVVYNKNSSTGILRYKPLENKSGKTTITVKLAAANVNYAKEIKFDVVIEKNLAPKIDPVSDQISKSGEDNTIDIKNIDDGNPNAKQKISIEAESSNPELIPNPKVSYISDDFNGLLTYKSVEGKTGQAVITVIVTDNGGKETGGEDTKKISFKIDVYNEINNTPTIDNINDVSLLDGGETTFIKLQNITNGDNDSKQNLNITVKSSNPELIPDPKVEYENGAREGRLTISVINGKIGKALISVIVQDDGKNANNNGDASKVVTFSVDVRKRPIIGFSDDYNDNKIDPVLANSGEGAHKSTEEKSALKIVVDKYKSNNIWAGLWYDMKGEIDISDNPYVSVKVKTDTPTDMVIYLWDYKNTYNTTTPVKYSISKNYVTYYYDFTNNLLGGSNKVDTSRIKALLINFSPGSFYKGTVYFDDFKVGDKVKLPNYKPTTTMDNIPTLFMAGNSETQNIELSGITNGKGDKNKVKLSVKCSDTALIPEMSVSEVSDGHAVLSLKPAADKLGDAKITVRVTAEGSKSMDTIFTMKVLKNDTENPVNLDINLNKSFQEIDGLGAFMGSGNVNESAKALGIKYAIDSGMTIARFGIIDSEFEPVNDNSNPNVTDYDKFNYNALPLDLMRSLNERTEIKKFVVTIWSPPAWMKENKCLAASTELGMILDNRLMGAYYQEFAESLVAMVKAVKWKTGIDLYGVSLQNEPVFNEPYGSAILDSTAYVKLLKIVGPRFEKEGIKTKIFMPEGMATVGGADDYISELEKDPTASKYTEIYAAHNYDSDGIKVRGAAGEVWSRIYETAQKIHPMKVWMSETSGHTDNWDGAMQLAGHIYTAMKDGNISAWIYWDFWDNLLNHGEANMRYAVSKQYFSFIKPGAVRVECKSSNKEVYTLAFKNEKTNKLTIILINSSYGPQAVNLSSDLRSKSFEKYESVENRSCLRGMDVTEGTVTLQPYGVTTLCGDLN